jgi:hypothetical protein
VEIRKSLTLKVVSNQIRALGLPTLDEIPEPDLLEPLLSLIISVKKKLYYIIVLANKDKLKKKIVSNIGERNII